MPLTYWLGMSSAKEVPSQQRGAQSNEWVPNKWKVANWHPIP